jgi:diaminohydroxyphosphoribosylaminopyrimidine deaminase/5-amino-6-(5-phosphoribosylamino)uracil reductase
VESRLVQSISNRNESQSAVLVFCASPEPKKKSELEARGIRVEQLPAASNGRLDLHAVLQRLGQLEITSLMIEGGAAVNGAALASGVVDKLFLYYAPTFLGADAVPFAADTSFNPLPQKLRLKNLQLHRFEEDIALEGYLRDPYEE